MDPYKIIMYPLMGEKATILREKENKLSFIVADGATKKDVAEAVESLYSVKVTSINIIVTTKGKKKAHVRLDPKFSAEEIATQFGVL
jgi:large subunit ribosomal protein L23